MKPIRDSAGNVVAYEHDANANHRELRSKSNGLLAWYDRTAFALCDDVYSRWRLEGRKLWLIELAAVISTRRDGS